MHSTLYGPSKENGGCIRCWWSFRGCINLVLKVIHTQCAKGITDLPKTSVCINYKSLKAKLNYLQKLNYPHDNLFSHKGKQKTSVSSLVFPKIQYSSLSKKCNALARVRINICTYKQWVLVNALVKS